MTTLQDIHQWGLDRKIIQNGKLETQWLKLLSEFGEMADSLAKGKSPVDDIGDQIVVLAMMAGITGAQDALERAWGDVRMELYPITTYVGIIAITYAGLRYRGNQNHGHYHDALANFGGIANEHDLTLQECLDHAYAEIKDRRGYLNEQGVFIKE
jgi:hypothetical protein